MNEIIVDSFAGGGGTSEGIRLALGRDPDIAINHDPMALAMHRMNHPGTRHMVEDVWSVDARSMCDGAPIGLLWMSPDCKHFSKAKGGKPREKAIRGLAWVGVRWVKSLPKHQRPRVVILENVEEFQDWGPLDEDGKPCPLQKGVTFRTFISAWKSLGYVAEWKELRACDYGDPTIRKRLFVILRRDGLPIVWPARSHGNPKNPDDAALIADRRLKPWRTAAEIIDWSLPCPSIFETSAEIKQRWGLRAQRPLKPATMARVAKGTKRYVIDAAEPFIVPVTHAGDFRVNGVDEPLRTQTTAKRGEHAVVTPFVTKFNRGATGQPVTEPLATVTSHASETHGGGAAPLGIVAPVLVGCGGRAAQSEPRPGDEPVLTQTAKADGCVAAIHLSTMRNAEKPFQGADQPTHTLTAGGANQALVAAFLAQHNTGVVGRDARDPLSTVTTGGKVGGQQGVVAAHMLNMRGSDRRHAAIDTPVPTVSAGGNHAAAVFAFLAKYYGEGLPCQGVDEPVHTVTTKPRHGLVTVTIGGEPYVVTDIGMRMLTPRERFSAQGFGPAYVIDRGLLEDGAIVNFTLEQQGRMCGNSVCPGMSRALVGSNYTPRRVARRPLADAPLLVAAE